MDTPIPSAKDLAGRLEPLTREQLERLADESKVPYHTLLKIKRGETTNPRVDTVRAVWPLVAHHPV